MQVYLDNAATSHPKPECVVKAVVRGMTELNCNPGRSGHDRAIAGAMALMSCRESLAKVLGCDDAMSVAFAFNCTDALNLAIKGSLSYADHVVTTMLEHNSVIRPLRTLEAQGMISLSIVEPNEEGIITPNAIRARLKRNTRLVAVTHASNVTGVIQPVAAIGKMLADTNAAFLVDGAQAIGVLPVNVKYLGATMYAFPGHKGLLGPQGTGGVYIDAGFDLNTVREGGTGSSSELTTQPRERPERYESGTVNLHGLAGLDAGANFAMENELTIRSHERALVEQMQRGLSQIDAVTVYCAGDVRNRVGVVSFNIGDYSSSAVADCLNRAGIAVRGGLHCAPGTHITLGTLERGAVRASVGYATSAGDVEKLIKEVHNIAGNGLR
ncbi:MAG: aminotransferase class V-fold PLP-dependent enzyme [Clostridia bacterium]|nr:aminotransferase class V-fold PLP-dependent enzyme [Clostridia bacterium]